MRISDWSSDVCSSDLHLRQIVVRLEVGLDHEVGKAARQQPVVEAVAAVERQLGRPAQALEGLFIAAGEHLGRGGKQSRRRERGAGPGRSEEHTSELQSLMRI